MKLMKYILIFFAVICSPYGAWAQDTALNKTLINATLLACMPNAMDMLAFKDENQKALDAAGVQLSDAIPPALAKRLAMQENPLTAKSKSAPANIVFVSSPNVHLCTIGVINTPATELRAALIAELEHKDAPWKRVQSEVQNGIAMQTYKWSIEGKNDILINISGPEKTMENGSGLQLMVRVAQVKG